MKWLNIIVPVLIAAVGVWVQIGTWPARMRRTVRADLEIVNGMPDGAEREQLLLLVRYRTQELLDRENRSGFIAKHGQVRVRAAAASLGAITVVLMGITFWPVAKSTNTSLTVLSSLSVIVGALLLMMVDRHWRQMRARQAVDARQNVRRRSPPPLRAGMPMAPRQSRRR